MFMSARLVRIVDRQQIDTTITLYRIFVLRNINDEELLKLIYK